MMKKQEKEEVFEIMVKSVRKVQESGFFMDKRAEDIAEKIWRSFHGGELTYRKEFKRFRMEDSSGESILIFENYFYDIMNSFSGLITDSLMNDLKNETLWKELFLVHFKVNNIGISYRVVGEEVVFEPDVNEFIRNIIENIINGNKKNYELISTEFYKNKAANIKWLLDFKYMTKQQVLEYKFFDEINIDEVIELKENLNEEDTDEYVQYKLNEYLSQKNKKISTLKKIFYFLPKCELIKLYVDGKISDAEFKIMKISKDDIFELSTDMILNILNKRTYLPVKINITSKDIINQYGKSLTGNDIKEFLKDGFVDSKDFINIFYINEALKLANYNEELMIKDDEIDEYYNEEILVNLYENGELVESQFVERYKKFINRNQDNTDYLDKKSKSIVIFIEEVKQYDKDRLCKIMLDFYKRGLFSSRVLKENLSLDYVENLYLNGEINEEQLYQLYKDKVIDGVTYLNYIDLDEILEMYIEGKVDIDVLECYNDKEALLNKIIDFYPDKLSLENTVSLYLRLECFNLDFLQLILSTEDIDSIDWQLFEEDFINFNKILELYQNKIIDYNLLNKLKDDNKITVEQFDLIKDTIDKEEFFEELKDGKVFRIATSRINTNKKKSFYDDKNDAETSLEKTRRQTKLKDFFDLEQELLSRFLGIDTDENVAYIESLNGNGKPTSLDGYMIYGNKDKDIVVFRKRQLGNALFIMPVYQAMYFLNGVQSNNAVNVSNNKLLDKETLRKMDQVMWIVHSKHFGEKLKEAMFKFSPKIADKMKNDEQYRSDVEDLIAILEENYNERHEKRTEEKS